MSWMDDLLEMLCHLYKDLGGNCSDLYQNPSQAPTKVVSQYAAQGAPTFSTPQAKDDFLANLDALEKHLLLSGNTLEDSDNFALTGLIADLREDLS